MITLTRARVPTLICLSALIFAADRLTKVWINVHVPLGRTLIVIPSLLNVTHSENDGAGFSILHASSWPQSTRWALVGLSLLIGSAVLLVMIRSTHRTNLSDIALSLIMAGSIGNAYDRLMRGAVIDFVEVHLASHYWPDFNLSDFSIVVGVCSLLLASINTDWIVSP